MVRKTKDLSFEEALARLEELTQTLEKGDLPLNEALTCYQEGTALLEHCQNLLGAAEETLKVLELKGARLVGEGEKKHESQNVPD